MDNTDQTTHIRITRELKKFIESKGTYGESHDEILKGLLKYDK